VTWNSNTVFETIALLEYSGIDTSSPLDAVVGANGIGYSPDGGTITMANANELIVVGTETPFAAADIVPGTGYTERVQRGNETQVEDQNAATATGYQTDSTSGNYSYLVVAAAFKEPGGGGGGSIVPILMHQYRQRSAV
jgi:hypothetical protein